MIGYFTITKYDKVIIWPIILDQGIIIYNTRTNQIWIPTKLSDNLTNHTGCTTIYDKLTNQIWTSYHTRWHIWPIRSPLLPYLLVGWMSSPCKSLTSFMTEIIGFGDVSNLISGKSPLTGPTSITKSKQRTVNIIDIREPPSILRISYRQTIRMKGNQCSTESMWHQQKQEWQTDKVIPMWRFALLCWRHKNHVYY